MKEKGKRKFDSKEVRAAYVFLIPSLIGMVIFSLLPLIVSAVISLTDWNGLDRLLAPGFLSRHFVGLKNFVDILTGQEFWKVLLNTIKFIVLYIPFMLCASLLVAFLLSRVKKGVGIFRVMYYIPVLTSWVAASLIWKSVLSPEYGAINNILKLIGIRGPDWLLSESWAMPAIALVSIWKDMGFFGLILLSGIIAIDKSYYEAASIDGAGSVSRFFRITLPLLTPSVFYVLIVSLINSFQLFPQIMIMTEGGPNGVTQVMVERIYKYGFNYHKMGYASAFSWLLFVIIMICTMIQMKGQNRWVNYDA